MLNQVPPTDCMHAREAASARLDGEGTELDGARLDAHLLGCPACRTYEAAIAGVAIRLRAAPLEQPRSEIGVSHRPRTRMTVVAAAAAVAFVAAVTGSSFAVGRVLGSHASSSRVAVGTADAVGLHRDTAQQHLLAMLNSFELIQPPRTGRMHAL
jgi:predicted anti-sigma-YlaC factor YlaD